MALIMWRSDLKLGNVVRVECPDGLWPNKDADGEDIFINTHYETEAKAWKYLIECAESNFSFAVGQIEQKENDLLKAKEYLVESAKRLQKIKNISPHITE